MSESRVRAALKLIDTSFRTKSDDILAFHKKRMDDAQAVYDEAKTAATKKINDALKVTARAFGAEIDDHNFCFEQVNNGWMPQNKADSKKHPAVMAAKKALDKANDDFAKAQNKYSLEAEAIRQLIVLDGLTDEALDRLKAFIS